MQLSNADAYKARQEAFVAGLSGSSWTETIGLLFVIPACVLLLRALLGWCTVIGGAASPRQWSATFRFATEFVVLVLPTLLNLTALAGWAVPTVAVAGAGAAVLHALAYAARGRALLSMLDAPDSGARLLASQRRKAFVNSFRSGMMLSTVIAILAVDFPVFPRRYAKTETFGVSIMDLGVGAFVFAAALVSRLTRHAADAEAARDGKAAARGESTAGPSQVAAASAADATVQPRPPTRRGRSVSRRAPPGAAPMAVAGRLGAESVRVRSSRTPGSRAPPRRAPSAGGAPPARAPAPAPSLLWRTVSAVSPIVAIGVVRLVVHAAIGYHAHVTEYGVHWNFFFTLAAVAVLSAVLEGAVGACAGCRVAGVGTVPRSSGGSRGLRAAAFLVLGAVLSVVHQAVLLQPLPRWLLATGNAALASGAAVGSGPQTLQDYVLYAARDDGSFVSQNREGLLGIAGFFAIYVAGIGVGVLLLDPGRSSAAAWRRAFAPCVAGCAALWLATAAATHVAGPVSRRLVNLPYVCLVLAWCCTLLAALLAVDLATRVPVAAAARGGSRRGREAAEPDSLPPGLVDGGSFIFESMNVNFLAVFIVANLLVGVVNGSVRTLDTPDGPAVAVLAAYVCVVSGVAVVWRVHGVTLKCW